eukprot:symbB.v1.2.000635.t1/scaffold7.1/size571927/3
MWQIQVSQSFLPWPRMRQGPAPLGWSNPRTCWKQLQGSCTRETGPHMASSFDVPTVSPHRRPSSQVSGSNGMDEIAEDDIVEEDAQGMLQELEGIMASMEEELLGSEHREKTDATSPQATPQRLDQNDEELMAEILQDLSDIKLT